MRNKTLHEKVEWLYGTGDMRLIYGMGAPVLAVTALIVIAAVVNEVWLVPALMFVVAVMTLIVLAGINQMLDDEDSDEHR